jgi:formylglycine-generating enzyme required for sulfatase activity
MFARRFLLPESLAALALAAAAPAALAADAAPGSVFRDCAACPEMVVIPAGSFAMGSPEEEKGRDEDEGPVHTVTLLKPFALGRFEVTWDEWAACVKDHACEDAADEGWGRGRRPAINMSHPQAEAYVKWLARTTGKPYRLPSESEWEYAARAGSTAATPWGADAAAACRHGNVYDRDSEAKYMFQWKPMPCADGQVETGPAGAYAANAFGLHDMIGNVFEWTADCYLPSYAATPADGSPNTAGPCFKRMARGGSWNIFPQWLRFAYRYGIEPVKGSNNVGVRVARDL